MLKYNLTFLIFLNTFFCLLQFILQYNESNRIYLKTTHVFNFSLRRVIYPTNLLLKISISNTTKPGVFVRFLPQSPF